MRAGVTPDNIYIDHASGAKASRPELDKALASANRDGDQLVITRLDRLGRSVLHLVTLGADLRERGVGLVVLEQGIDTTTMEGRAMFGMLSVLAELQRELIVANTRWARRCPRPRTNRGKTPEADARPGPPRPAALRCGESHRPADRRPAPGPALHDLRPPQQRKHRTAPHRQRAYAGLALNPSPLLPRPRPVAPCLGLRGCHC